MGSLKAMRERWLAHLETTRRRCVLLIDEAQEMTPAALCELRLLASARFDSQQLLCVQHGSPTAARSLRPAVLKPSRLDVQRRQAQTWRRSCSCM